MLKNSTSLVELATDGEKSNEFRFYNGVVEEGAGEVLVQPLAVL